MTRFIKAVQGLHHSVIYTDDRGRHFRYSCGTWTWRNHNPGNLVSGHISKKHNQIGVAGGFAVFSDSTSGHSALLDCLHTTYANKSIDQMVDGYAPKKCNPRNHKYKKFLHEQTGVFSNKKIRDFTQDGFSKLWKAIEQFEGWEEEGYCTEVYKISSVHVDKKNIISSYYSSNVGWLSKQECINLAKQDKIEAEICRSILHNAYLRAKGKASFQVDFRDLIEKENEK